MSHSASEASDLPCRMSPAPVCPSTTRRLAQTRPIIARLARVVTRGALSLALPLALAASSVLPADRPARIGAPAASFAAAGMLGAIGDPAGVSDVAASSPQRLPVYGTLAFGDPDTPVFPPIVDEGAPPDDGAGGGVVAPVVSSDPAPAAPAEPAPEAPPAAPAEGIPPAPAETTEAPPPAPAEPAPPAPSEAAPVAPAEAAPPAPAEPVQDEVTTRGVRASEIARALVGRPYRYGASGPRAFDCSGLTLYVYRQLGIALPHKARSQFNTRYGRLIPSIKELAPGDLVFFRNTAGRGITHAAIYVGGGMMVTADSPRRGVRLSSINDSYWRRHWAGGIRPGL